jgi:four helix bundle protein
MSKIERFEDLQAWQKAHRFVLDVYQLTRDFPKDEMFCLTSQLRRSAISTPSNIVEGFSRWSNADKARHYNIAEASLEESRYQLLLAHDLGYADTTALRESALEAKRILVGLAQSTRSRS